MFPIKLPQVLQVMHKAVPEIPQANGMPSFASHCPKLTPFPQTVLDHHQHQLPGCHPSGGAGGHWAQSHAPQSAWSLAAQTGTGSQNQQR